MTKISYSGYRFPPEIIQQAIWLYIRFTLSFRDVEDLLAERGMSLPKSRFERTDDVARQESDAQRRLRTARLGVCRARPSRAKHAFAPRYNRWHISQGFGEGAQR